MLQVGTRLGPFEITGPLGAGGMGEVYRATDLNLKRQVAIKVLPESLAGDEERLARFQREAELLASLNHPNIASVYGLERTETLTALVMELVEGPTLAELLARGAMPFDEVQTIGRQIAHALEAAHARGIIHRDLKPANIKIRPDGTVKVLDFGLAKALEPPGSTGASHDSPTITSPAMTVRGVILGTAAYMSPEQARGRAVDRRADIWSLGCVLYEMLTGRRPFVGDDVSETLARVIDRDPDWNALPPTVPPVFAAVLRRCLQKNPAERLHDAGDLRLALDGAFEVGSAPAASVRRVSTLVPMLSAALVAAGLVTAVAWTMWPRAEPLPPGRFAVDVPDDHTFRSQGRTVLAVAPDGRSFVYNTTRGLYRRTFDDLVARLVPGTEEDASNPFFSPDGRWIGYWSRASGQLKRVAASGGSGQVIATTAEPFGADWGADDVIVFADVSGLWTVAAGGGTPALAIPSASDERVIDPQWLPGDRVVMFSTARVGEGESAKLVAQRLGGGARTVLTDGTNGRYLSGGFLVYVAPSRDVNAVYGVRFDVGELAVHGDPLLLIRAVARSQNFFTAVPNFGIARDGMLVYLEPSPAPHRRVVWVDRQGREEDVGMEPGEYVYLRLSPDGTRVAVDDRNEANDIWVWDLRGRTRVRLSLGDRGGFYPVWSLDGRRILYDSRDGRVSSRNADDSGDTTIVRVPVAGRTGPMTPYFSAADGTVAVRLRSAIGLLPADPGQAPDWIPEDGASSSAINATLSPDGRWIAYESAQSSREEVYIAPFPHVHEGRVVVSSAGGFQPVWSRNGRELFFLTGPARLQPDSLHVAAVDVTGTTATVQSRRRLMPWPYASPVVMRGYDVGLDGQRFLALKNEPLEKPSPRRFIVVQHWRDELARLMPPSR